MRKQYSCFICEAIADELNECVECHHTVCEKHYLTGMDPVRSMPIKGCFLCVGKQQRVSMKKFFEEVHAD